MTARTVLAVAMATSATVVMSAFQEGAGRGRPLQGPNAIVGRVLDPAGQPVPGTPVTAVVRDSTRPHGFQFVSARLVSIADREGRYRLDGLTFGEHLVVALPRNAPLDATRRLNRAGYANTFHPGTRELSAAQAVTVSVKGPAIADITLVPATLAAISGTVTSSKGASVSGGTIQLATGDGFFGLEGRSVLIRPDGSFVAPALQPGTYHLHYREGAWPAPVGTTPLISLAKVTLDGEDRSGVRVLPVTMTPVSGRVTFNGGPVDPATVRVSGAPLSSDGNPGPTQSGVLKSDSTFEFLAWPGPHRARVFVNGQEWAVTVLRWQGRDVRDTGFDVRQGTPVTGIELVVELRRRPR